MGKENDNMGFYKEEDLRAQAVRQVAERMAIAARTAPKGRGVDNLVIGVVEKDVIQEIAAKMKEMAEREDLPGFSRDAGNILEAEAMVLIGTKLNAIGLKYCGLCGFKNCAERNEHPEHPCAFNTGDLGIAIGSAVSVAMEARVDNRIMYTVGMAVREMKLLGDDVKVVYGIPLSAGPKNPFFDRK